MGVLVAGTGCKPDRLPGEGSFREVHARSAGTDSQAEHIPLARIGRQVLSLGAFDREVSALPPAARQLFDTPERRIALLEMLVQIRVLAREAARMGLVDGPVEELFVLEERAKHYLEHHRATAEVPLSLDSISEEDLRVAWETEVAPWLAHPSRRAMTIVAPDEPTAHAWALEAERLRHDSRETSVGIARWMARDRSIDAASAERGGDLGWIRRPRDGQETTNWEPLVDAVFALGNAGDLSRPLQTARGWEILSFRSVRRAFDVTPEGHEALLREELLARRLAEADTARLAELRLRQAPVRFEDAIARAEQARLHPPGSRVARRFEADGIARAPAAFLTEQRRREFAVDRRDAALHNPAVAADRLALEPAEPPVLEPSE